MPEETVSLDFLAHQLERILNRLGAIEDQITVPDRNGDLP